MSTINWIGSSGDWTDASDWSSGTVPGPADNAEFSGSNFFTVKASTAIDVGDITIDDLSATLDITTGTQTATVKHNVTNWGVLNINGVSNDPGGTTLNVGGTLTNNSFGTVHIGFPNQSASTLVTVANFDNEGSVIINGGTQNNGVSSSLIVTHGAAPGTLSTGRFNLSGSALVEFASGSITSIGSEAQITLNGAEAFIADAHHTGSNSALSGLTNNAGTLDLGEGASLTNLASAFTNSGSLDVEDGTFGTASQVDFDNTGTFTGGSDEQAETITIGGTLTNTGTVEFDSFSSGSLTKIVVGHLVNSGTIDLLGSTDPASPGVVFEDTSDAAPTTLASGVTLNLSGNVLLKFGSGHIQHVANGATLELDESGARIADAGATSTNSALTELKNNAGNVVISDGAVLTLGAHGFTNTGSFSVINNTSFSLATGENFVNSGILYVDSDANLFDEYGGSTFAIGGTLENSGVLSIGDNGGHTATAPTIVTVEHLANTGAISLHGSLQSSGDQLVELNVEDDMAAATLQAGASFALTGNALVEFASGFITAIASGASLSLDGENARIADSTDTTTASALRKLSDNAGTLSLSDGAALHNQSSAFTNSGIFSISQNTKVTTSGDRDFTNSGTLDIDAAGDQGGSLLQVGKWLYNSGTITIGADGGLTNASNLTASSEISAIHLANTGIINLFSSQGSANRALLDVSDGIEAALKAGASVNLLGNALLEYQSGSLTTIDAGASLLLDGTRAFVADAGQLTSNSALSALNSNAGTLTFADGAVLPSWSSFDNSGTFSLHHKESLEITQNFENTGTLNVDSGSTHNKGDGQSNVEIDETLSNTGTINVGNTKYIMSGNATLTVSDLSNSGTINISSTAKEFNGSLEAAAQATLNDLGDAAPTALAAGVSINLLGNALLEFSSGSITTIDEGAELKLNGAQTSIADHGNNSANSALSELSDNAGTLTLTNGASVANGGIDFSNTGSLNVDSSDFADQNTLLAIGGNLDNSGKIVLSNTNESAATWAHITAATMDNTGSISSVGESSMIFTGNVTNSGTIVIGNPDDIGGALATAGTFTQTAGETDLNGTGLVADNGITISGGVVQGTGLIEGDGESTFHMTVSGGTLAALLTDSPIGSDYLIVDGKLTVDSAGTIGVTLSGGSEEGATRVDVDTKLVLNGGSLDLNVTDPSALEAGENFVVMTFRPGDLMGEFAQVADGSNVGNATGVNIGNGLTLDVIYDNSDGEIQINVVDTPHVPFVHHDTVTSLDENGALHHHGSGDFVTQFEHGIAYDVAPFG